MLKLRGKLPQTCGGSEGGKEGGQLPIHLNQYLRYFFSSLAVLFNPDKGSMFFFSFCSGELLPEFYFVLKVSY